MSLIGFRLPDDGLVDRALPLHHHHHHLLLPSIVSGYSDAIVRNGAAIVGYVTVASAGHGLRHLATFPLDGPSIRASTSSEATPYPCPVPSCPVLSSSCQIKPNPPPRHLRPRPSSKDCVMRPGAFCPGCGRLLLLLLAGMERDGMAWHGMGAVCVRLEFWGCGWVLTGVGGGGWREGEAVDDGHEDGNGKRV